MSNLYFNNVEKVGQLYLEYVFFEFESEPILFICHDQLNQTYLCLCSDIRHGQKWIITKCDTKILRALITAEIDPLDLPKPGTFIRCNKEKAQNYLLQLETNSE